jgi:hypothetical protein
MSTAIWLHFVYIVISVVMTVWVARTLHKNGRVFLIDAFRGNESFADSVNHLLVVGFYLINFGFIMLYLRYGEKPNNLLEGIEYTATRIGVVLVVLGAMHFFNMFNFDKMRRKGRLPDTVRPSVSALPQAPSGRS